MDDVAEQLRKILDHNGSGIVDIIWGPDLEYKEQDSEN